jgi:hypothetical protein
MAIAPITIALIVQRINTLRVEFEHHANEALADGAAVLFAEIPNLNLVRVIGYTPGFNDGDPCVHCQYVIVGNGDEEGYVKGRHADTFSERELEDDDGNPLRPNPGMTVEEENTVDAFFRAFTDTLAKIHGTNFQLDYTRGLDSSVTVSKDNYDCGY